MRNLCAIEVNVYPFMYSTINRLFLGVFKNCENVPLNVIIVLLLFKNRKKSFSFISFLIKLIDHHPFVVLPYLKTDKTSD